jgi:hypothetical protein
LAVPLRRSLALSALRTLGCLFFSAWKGLLSENLACRLHFTGVVSYEAEYAHEAASCVNTRTVSDVCMVHSGDPRQTLDPGFPSEVETR